MSTASHTSQSPGDPINAETFNSAFDSIEEASGSLKLDKDNFADECIGPRMLARLSVCSHRITVENTKEMAGTLNGNGAYSGGGFHIVSHGNALPLEIVFGGGAGVFLNEGDVLRMEWTQYLYSVVSLDPNTPMDITWTTRFYPRWDLGNGYTGAGMTYTGPEAWIAEKTIRAGRTVQTASNESKFKEQNRRHARGSGVYIAPSGGKTIIKLGLLMSAPLNLNAITYLGQGSITAMIYRR